MSKPLTLVAVAVLALPTAAAASANDRAAPWREEPAVTALFRDAGVDGTFVLLDERRGELRGHNRERAEQRLPFPRSAQRQVAEITQVDSGPGWSLHAKTGWQNAPGPGVGWWVGWVQKGDQITPFALNIAMAGAADAPKRERLGRSSLRPWGSCQHRQGGQSLHLEAPFMKGHCLP